MEDRPKSQRPSDPKAGESNKDAVHVSLSISRWSFIAGLVVAAVVAVLGVLRHRHAQEAQQQDSDGQPDEAEANPEPSITVSVLNTFYGVDLRATLDEKLVDWRPFDKRPFDSPRKKKKPCEVVGRDEAAVGLGVTVSLSVPGYPVDAVRCLVSGVGDQVVETYYLADKRLPQLRGRLVTLKATYPDVNNDDRIAAFLEEFQKQYLKLHFSPGRLPMAVVRVCREDGKCDDGAVVVHSDRYRTTVEFDDGTLLDLAGKQISEVERAAGRAALK